LKVLLDTHLLIWILADPDRTPKAVIEVVIAPENDVCVSAVSIAEISIKHKRNRGEEGDMPISGEQALALTEASNIALLSLDADHAAMLDSLPLHHRDPFDRMLVAQAMCEDRTLLTSDSLLAAYGDFVKVV
jgi:PIN domain nuclease of toxin-antitoxin system